MWVAGRTWPDGVTSNCWTEVPAGMLMAPTQFGCFHDLNCRSSSAQSLPHHSHSAVQAQPLAVQAPRETPLRPVHPAASSKHVQHSHSFSSESVPFIPGQHVPMQYIQTAYKQAVNEWPRQSCVRIEPSRPKSSNFHQGAQSSSGGAEADQQSSHACAYFSMAHVPQPQGVNGGPKGTYADGPPLTVLRLPDDVAVFTSSRLRTAPACPHLTASVFGGDTLIAIMQHLSQSDCAAMRLTCRSWKESVSSQIRYLRPRTLPDGHACPLQCFPAVSAVDLTAAGPRRMRSVTHFLAGCEHQLTRVALGDQHGRASWFTNKDMSQLARMSSLRALSLLNPKSVTIPGFLSLKSLKQLEDLKIVDCKCITEALSAMCSAWPMLTRLATIGCKGTIRETGAAQCWPQQLQHLHVARESVAVLGFKDLEKFPALQHLVIADTACPMLTQPQGMPQLALLTGLASLSLQDVTVQFDAVRAVLLALTGLSSLTLTSTDTAPLPCEGLEKSLGRLNGLRDLDLTGLSVPWTILLANVGLTSLTMNVPHSPQTLCHMTQKMIAALPLKHLKLMAVRGDRPLPALLGCLTATTSISLCASAPCKEGQGCERQSKLFATLQCLLPQLTQLQGINLLLPTDLEVIRILSYKAPSAAVACLQGCCRGLDQCCEYLAPAPVWIATQ
eukprot:jgi/Ulvmu1/8028/UM004_0265.1